MSFATLGLSENLLKKVTKKGYAAPSPIQIEAIPAVLTGRDVLAVAPTGTGKTAAFTLPLLQLLSSGKPQQTQGVRALVITPTRELAAQVALSVETYCKDTHLGSLAVFGGVRIEPQIAALQQGVDVLIATPGRLLDLYQQQTINFDALEILVLDEADRMLDLGFVDQMQRIQSLLPSTRQTLLFSATFSTGIKSLATSMLNKPIELQVSVADNRVESVKQTFYSVDKSAKTKLLVHLLRQQQWPQVLVFSRTKKGADSLVAELEKAGVKAASMHANRSQHARTQILDGFKHAEIRVLVATDIVSRGIDVDKLACVVNFDLPYVPEDYVHRIGRTGRAGSVGLAVTLVSQDEFKQLAAIARLIGRKCKPEVVPGFAPTRKTKATPEEGDDDLYGNFEPDSKKQGKGRNGRAKSNGKTAR